jgi:hypothetical protein
MRRIRLAVGAAAVGFPLLTAQLAANPPRPVPEPGQDVTVLGKKDKTICKTSTETGSILPKRVCRPASEWESARQRSLEQLERIEKEMETERWIRESRRAR